MIDVVSGDTRHFLQPARLVLAESPAKVRTVLGSCVAITIRAPAHGLAAVVHCLLPSAGRGAAELPEDEALKYVDTSLDLMLLELATRGVSLASVEVKLFGGAEHFDADGGGDYFSVGRRNVEAALEALERRNLHPVAQATGGDRGRVIDFDSATGDVLVRRLPRNERSHEE